MLKDPDLEPAVTAAAGARERGDGFLFNSHNLPAFAVGLQQSIDLLQRKLAEVARPHSGVSPGELAQAFAPIDLDRPLGSMQEVLSEVERLYLDHAIYFHHPKYLAHLNCPIVYPAILAELILCSVNSSLDTWDQSAGATLIEQKLIDWCADKIGYGAAADGVFTSGGTQSNLMALLLARDSLSTARCAGHSNKTDGLPQEAHRFRIFTSQVSHFSVQKSAAILGLGHNAVVPVSCDRRFKMDIAQLRRAIVACLGDGHIPMAVVATAGTTDFGSIDPLDEIADLCEEYGLWLHADAAYGCGLLVAQNLRYLLGGIERADSVTVDYHKSFFQPVSCGAFFVKDGADLALVTHHAEYLNPLSQRREGTPNLVDKSIQTTRRFDALKLWLTLRIMGPGKLGDVFERVTALARQAYCLLDAQSSIDVLHRPELSTLVFRYRPNESHSASEIDAANEFIRKAIFRSGQAVIASTKVGARRYLKFTILNPATTLADIEAVVELIIAYGRQYLAQPESTPSVQTQRGADNE
ncbi:aspartate aminotransferase family protein [Exilibacterium tricleocarpae]|uniref:Aspartate aminotransferase family protein n=1 Tax=Exilibacterium tricleocarpae TaxID=2591008 RepID=A0A545U5G9_9GAMM|nr:aspartate aminotransferase family protein [Exilibacterium tricleocarpae]TQV84725.1 aspartate aminotransferase family protein [Exilibacterium tricleocarpae]